MTDPISDDDALASFMIETGHLKRTRRAGWQIAGVRDPESVAEHSYRTGVIAYILAVMEGANPDRAAALAVFHDVPETRIGDVPSIGRAHVSTAAPQEVVKAQTARLPESVAAAVRGLIGEFEAKETPEARCAKDADKLECLLQAREYQSQGYQLMQPWVDTMVSAVRTGSGQRLAQAACTLNVDDWWHDVVAAYDGTHGQRQ
jgi:putative hydrolase of HD superfamily